MRLSICIPTHHGRCNFLKEAIESVLTQLTPDLREQVEICVSDNASEDGTRELMQQYIKSYGHLLIYHRNERNMGLNYNLIKVVEIAHGDYCWYLSSDDQIASGGIAKVLQLLEEHPDTTGVTVNWVNFDLHMVTPLEEDRNRAVMPKDYEDTHVYLSADDIFANCAACFGLMSTQIFNRKMCLDIIRETGLQRLGYFRSMVQAYLIGAIVKKHPEWIWYPEKLVKYRADNNSLLEERGHKYVRLHLDILEDASRAWSEIIGKPSLVSLVINKNKEKDGSALSIWRVPVAMKLQPNHTLLDDLRMLIGFTKYYYFLSEYWLTVFPILLMPHPFLKGAIALKNRLGIGTRLRALRARIG